LDKRYAAIQFFKNNLRTKVLIASLQAGGQGLNLTMANRVIIMDPWWNSKQYSTLPLAQQLIG
jgi:SNF2 family DNA or RNA helicase